MSHMVSTTDGSVSHDYMVDLGFTWDGRQWFRLLNPDNYDQILVTVGGEVGVSDGVSDMYCSLVYGGLESPDHLVEILRALRTRAK